MPYDDLGYAQGRLVDTIIRYENKAVVVDAVVPSKQGLVIKSTAILTQEEIIHPLVEFNLEPVKLGMTNFMGNTVSYVARQPLRHDWRQGLRPANTIFAWGRKDWDAKAIAQTIEGLYPSLDEARELLVNEDDFTAWCRSFCINKAGDIYYRTMGKVGNFVDKTKNYLLDQKFFWVEQHLNEALK
jgi:hypothetical protein